MPVTLSADFIIIGSGIAGLRAAVTLAARGRVLLLTKADPQAGNTGYAQGGIAAAVGEDDSPATHEADTLAAGDGLCREAAVRVLVEEGPAYVQELIDWGAAFDRGPGGAPALAREGAHAVRRVLHSHDATGREIARVLAERVGALDGVQMIDHALVVGIDVRAGRARGVWFLDRAGRVCEARAAGVLVATGGAGQVYRHTTNPPVATGDGVAVAFLAGAAVMDLEFVQFHPTALDVPGQPRYLLSEALRGEGARLVNEAGEFFMARADPAGELAPRDRVARAIAREQARTGRPVYLTMAHLSAAAVRARFPLVADYCRRAGLDLAVDRIPVGPAAHYVMGGVATDVDGRSTVPDLFAAGEAACTGIHGANRLASNSLLEGLVFGARAAAAMLGASAWPAGPLAPAAGVCVAPPDGPRGDVDLADEALRDAMWRDVGLFRDAAGLTRVVDALEPVWRRLVAHLAAGGALEAAAWRKASLATVGRLIARAALRREESRGSHFRDDFPAKDDLHWKVHVAESRDAVVRVPQ